MPFDDQTVVRFTKYLREAPSDLQEAAVDTISAICDGDVSQTTSRAANAVAVARSHGRGGGDDGNGQSKSR